MKEFFNKVKTWIITHKVVSVVIAAVLIAGITLAIVLPVTLGGKTNTATYTESTDEYKITKADYDSYTDKIGDPLCLLTMNFTTKIGDVEIKVADGKIETEKAQEYDGYRAIFVLKADTYNESTGKIGVDSYINGEDEGEMIWGHTADTIKLYENYYGKSIGVIANFLGNTDYDRLKYIESDKTYVFVDSSGSFTMKFVNGILTRLEVAGENYVYEFTDIGTTTITLPTDFIEA